MVECGEGEKVKVKAPWSPEEREIRGEGESL